MARVRSKASNLVRSYSNLHLQGKKPNIFLLATPRSGSTWLLELLHSQPGVKLCNEPLNYRNPSVADFFGTDPYEVSYYNPPHPKLEKYLDYIFSGSPKVGFLNIFPFHRQKHRFLTHRIVFKVLHGMEDKGNWLVEKYNSKVIILLRHPIAVSLSREIFPRLELFLNSDYGRHFTAEQIEFARGIVAHGSKMEKGMLSWCLQNSVPLRNAGEDTLVVTYEQLTTETEKMISVLVDGLDLDPESAAAMVEKAKKPSSSTRKSDPETQQRLKEGKEEDRQRWLVEKWRSKVSEAEEAELMKILEVFEMDVYKAGSFYPTENYWYD